MDVKKKLRRDERHNMWRSDLSLLVIHTQKSKTKVLVPARNSRKAPALLACQPPPRYGRVQSSTRQQQRLCQIRNREATNKQDGCWVLGGGL
jgi:hypothetical protein